MYLFERIKEIAEKIAPSQTALGKELGLPQSKFNQYLNTVSEKNLWQYLPRIIEIYPQISREWLYFGEGDMLRAQGHGLQAVATPLKTVAHSPIQETEKDVRIRGLEQEVLLHKELLAAKDKIIALYEEKAENRLSTDEDVFSTRASGAPTTSGVAHFSHKNSEG